MELTGSVVSPMDHVNDHQSRAPSRQLSTASSTLLHPQSFEKVEQTMSYYLERNKSVNLFLGLMGVMWTRNDASVFMNSLQYFWNLLIRFCLGGMLLYFLFGFIVFTNDMSISNDDRLFIYVFLFTGVLQCLVLSFALFDIKNRLKSHVTSNLILLLNKGLSTSYIVLGISITLGIVPVIIYETHYGTGSVLISFGFGELSICCLLTATMYFITLDCSVADSLLDGLIEQSKMELLTFEQFDMARQEISLRQLSSSWINNAIVIVALLDFSSVLLYTLVFGSRSSPYLLLLELSIFVKEIPFVVVVYGQVAQVNEKSSVFVKNLAATRWTLITPTSLETGCCRDCQRLAIYANVQANPITMSLAGMKLKRRDLMWQFGVWCLAFAVGIVKAIVISKV